MRLMIPAMALTFMLSSCGDDIAAKDPRQVDQALAADDLEVNDLTAIDAISGADANMAADVDPSTWNESSTGDSSSDNSTSSTKKPAPKKSISTATATDEEDKPAEPDAPPGDGDNRTD